MKSSLPLYSLICLILGQLPALASEPIDILSLPVAGGKGAIGAMQVRLHEATIEESETGKVLMLQPPSGAENSRGGLYLNLGELATRDFEISCKMDNLSPGWVSLKLMAPGFLVSVEFSGSQPGVRIGHAGQIIHELKHVTKDQQIEITLRLLPSQNKFSVTLNGETTEDFELTEAGPPRTASFGYLAGKNSADESYITLQDLTIREIP